MTMIGYTTCVLTFCLTTGLVNAFSATVVDVREFSLAEDEAGSNICALDAPSVSLSLFSVLACALECERFSSDCENFNYKDVNTICELFFDRPKCYGPSPSCVHYQVGNWQTYKIICIYVFSL